MKAWWAWCIIAFLATLYFPHFPSQLKPWSQERSMLIGEPITYSPSFATHFPIAAEPLSFEVLCCFLQIRPRLVVTRGFLAGTAGKLSSQPKNCSGVVLVVAWPKMYRHPTTMSPYVFFSIQMRWFCENTCGRLGSSMLPSYEQLASCCLKRQHAINHLKYVKEESTIQIMDFDAFATWNLVEA